MEESKPLISNSMAKSTISDLRMEPATNGVIISYTEKREKESKKGCYDNCSWDYQKEVFDVDDKDDEMSGFEEAMNRFKELAMRQYKESKSK